MSSSCRAAVCALALVVAAACLASAQTLTTSGDWNSAANWNGGIPLATSGVTITGALVASINTVAAVASSLTLDSGATVVVANPLLGLTIGNVLSGGTTFGASAGSSVTSSINATAVTVLGAGFISTTTGTSVTVAAGGSAAFNGGRIKGSALTATFVATAQTGATLKFFECEIAQTVAIAVNATAAIVFDGSVAASIVADGTINGAGDVFVRGQGIALSGASNTQLLLSANTNVAAKIGRSAANTGSQVVVTGGRILTLNTGAVIDAALSSYAGSGASIIVAGNTQVGASASSSTSVNAGAATAVAVNGNAQLALNGAVAWSGNVNIATGGQLNAAATSAVTFTGATIITAQGTGAATFNGATNVNAGVVVSVAGNSNTGNGGATISASAAVTIDASANPGQLIVGNSAYLYVAGNITTTAPTAPSDSNANVYVNATGTLQVTSGAVSRWVGVSLGVATGASVKVTGTLEVLATRIGTTSAHAAVNVDGRLRVLAGAGAASVTTIKSQLVVAGTVEVRTGASVAGSSLQMQSATSALVMNADATAGFTPITFTDSCSLTGIFLVNLNGFTTTSKVLLATFGTSAGATLTGKFTSPQIVQSVDAEYPTARRLLATGSGTVTYTGNAAYYDPNTQPTPAPSAAPATAASSLVLASVAAVTAFVVARL